MGTLGFIDLITNYRYAHQEYSHMISAGGETAQGAVTTSYEVRAWTHNSTTNNYIVTTIEDEAGHEVETWTDGWGRKVRTVSDPNGKAAETIFEYDELGNLTKVISPNNSVTTYAYTKKGELTSTTSPDAGTVNYKYDRAGNLRFSQDAKQAGNSEVTFYTYDELGRVLKQGVATATFSNLDGNSSYSFETNSSNWKGVYAYDVKPSTSQAPWNQFSSFISGTSVTHTTGSLVARAWRVVDGVSSEIGSNPWQVEIYSYNSEGQLEDKWIRTGNKSGWDTDLSYSYNRQGEIITRGVTVGSQSLYQFYEYNQRGLLSAVYAHTTNSKPLAAEVSYSYTATGAIDQIDYKGSKDVDYAYTIRDWVEEINSIGSPNGNFAAYYDYTDNGNVSKAQFHNPQNQITGHDHYHQSFTYDGLNRLTSADYGTGSSGSSPYFDLTGLTYDDAGNLTGLKRDDDTGSLIDNLSYSYGSNSNRLQSISDGVSATSESWDAEDASFGYDANGNLTSQSGKISNISYDFRNLPVEFSMSGGADVVANYNADGQRILKELQGGGWQFYVMDGQQTLAVIDNNGFSHFNLVGNGTFGRWESGGDRRYYITDHLGSTRAVVDDAGTVLETFDYYPFGLLMPGRTSTSGNTMEKFTGHELDEEVGLNLFYAGARYLDPALGRWHSVDPLAAKYPGWSPYNYVLNNPVNAFDPDGRDVWFVHGTFSSPRTWTRDGINYDVRWASALNDNNYHRFDWRWNSKLNTIPSRNRAAKRLADDIEIAYMSNPDMLVQLVAHSHGGNVAIEAANILRKRGISVDRLVLLGTPSRDRYRLEEGAVKEGGLYNFSDDNDAIQKLGGTDFLLGLFGEKDTGLAGRSRSEEEGAIEIRAISNRGGKESHTLIHTTQELIDWIDEQLNEEGKQ